MRKFIKRALILTLTLFVLGTVAIWLVVRDEVAAVQSIAVRATEPVPPKVEAAIIAAESLHLEQPRITWRAWRALSPRIVACGPASIAFVVVRSASLQRRPSWPAAFVVGRMYKPQELLRFYAHDLYLGTIDGHEIEGVWAASQAYFGKTPQELTFAEAATIAAMIRSPHYYSLLEHPDRALDRRNKVLQQMHRNGVLSSAEFMRETRSPLRHILRSPHSADKEKSTDPPTMSRPRS